MTAQDILKQYFGYDSFRPGQDELVRAILSGRNTLGIMPTGAGKSICYQVPAMLFPGLTLVISPLISLMKDQVGALVEAGVPAACINSAMSAEEFRDALYLSMGTGFPSKLPQNPRLPRRTARAAARFRVYGNRNSRGS